ncbi:SusD/RagB family nutrient-binding outer membrane lipoprotein [Arenibacter sp. BSSL-BM3]|uniref:SusD/RagB family nutrient-binding outer membrane lipoprotein n=1 Tax=Arenibacter arenosicollis TaxID=2762274 RepID=A0ABR7QPE6_9FLAO|nr:SusD/RagB family nutrient-binding outer membrane lipoprotein [Arenibacter arenosicollis]MBC8769062.1 SusD/RagB family nutrient-binding outer membrane lipoprotein [Arenibacter arenosicollis]
MTRIKNNIIALLLPMVVLFATSCSESLEEINVSPNSLPDTEIDIKFVLTGILSQSATMTSELNMGAAEITATTQYLQRDFTSYDRFNFNWQASSYAGYYEPLKDSKYIFDRAEEEKTGKVKDYYQGVALIMKSYWYGMLTSLFGDLPYTNALLAENGGDEFFKPAYDDQLTIFKGIINDLTQANSLLTGAGVIQEVADADIVYQGDALKWRKLANSLRLRYYMRLSEKGGIDINPVAEISAIVGNSAEYPILVNNDDNAAIAFVGTNSDNSWYGGPLRSSNRSEFYRRKPSATIVDDLTALGDPRLTSWVRPVDVQIFEGATDEIVQEDGVLKRYTTEDINAINNDENKENDLNTSLFVGLPVALTDPNQFQKFAGGINANEVIASLDGSVYLAAASNPHASYLTEMYAEDANPLVKAVLMNAAEVQFILAEASVRGWISNSALDFYNSGILLSMGQYGISDGDQSAVYDKTNNTLVPFDQGVYMAQAQQIFNDATDKMEPIMHQKWISQWLTPESWFDWRRTGFPNLSVNIIAGTKGQEIPVRFYYDDPFNEENMLQAISKLQPAENDQWSKMWLLQ